MADRRRRLTIFHGAQRGWRNPYPLSENHLTIATGNTSLPQPSTKAF
ncbi:MAG: hypothetical protein BroJett012_06370 [Betaproteobacteria bacterium]|nr:MAG: hypothetical protein BroJett012_06370 [Betaproteobacteria bacterium]